MGRIITPLSMMGADITSLSGNGCAPLRIRPADLHGISYSSNIASAQVKSAILLAGLYADSETSVTEPELSRDHTERLLRAFGAELTSTKTDAGAVSMIQPCNELFWSENFCTWRHFFRSVLYRCRTACPTLRDCYKKCRNQSDTRRDLICLRGYGSRYHLPFQDQ